MGSIPTLASNLRMTTNNYNAPQISLQNTYKFITNNDDEILVKAYFEEEAIIKFQKNHQRIGPRYYKPVVFVSVEKVA